MAEDAPINWLQRAVEFLVQAATENWGTKILALLLALIVFVVTRDEVTRSFTIPLRVIEDPERVLLTRPPESVELRVRGPWANVNRLSAAELGAATLDLREVRPGPMELDPASIVMPQGVVLDTLEYDPVDLRFEALIDRALPIVPVVVGEVDTDHRLASMRVEPDSWTVRAPASEFDDLRELQTEFIDISGVSSDVDMRVEVEPPDAQLVFLGVREGELPLVRFVADVEALVGEVELAVATGPALREALPGLGEEELPAVEHVKVRGPRKLLRSLEAFEEPLRPLVEVETRAGLAAPIPVTVRFEWSPQVPATTAEQLSITPPLVRLRLSPRGGEIPW
jgi:hypothetical protein